MAKKAGRKTKKKDKKARRLGRENSSKQNKNNELIGVLVVGISIFSFLSVYTSSAGIIGVYYSHLLRGLFGIATYIIPFLIFVSGIFIMLSFHKKLNNLKIKLALLAIIIVMGLIHLIYYHEIDDSSLGRFIIDSYNKGIDNIGAGALISIVVYILYKGFGSLGSYLFFIVFLIIDILLLTNLSLKQMGKRIHAKLNKTKANFRKYIKYKRKDKKAKELTLVEEAIEVGSGAELPEPSYLEEAFNKIDTAISSRGEVEDALEDSKTEQLDDIKILNFDKDENIEKTDSEAVGKDENQSKDSSKKVNSSYKFPPLTLLKSPDYSEETKKISDIKLKNNARLLEDTLNNFGITARVIQVSCGPAVTRYELQPAPGIKVSRIVNLADDIALSLAATGVRIEAPIPGKAAVGIEVPNKSISTVLLREVLESQEFINHPSKLAFSLGKDIAGKVIVADIAKMPHLLIAGATGSGKSVCINALIASILYKATPEEVKLILIDPKIVELSHFNGIPHLLIPVVTDPKKAAGALNWAVQEMISRYKMFANKGVKDLERYNEIVDGVEETKLPQIVVVIDELADLMMVAPGEVEDAICRLAQMARAAGIHLVIATQRPSVDVITGVIKANIPSRIAFAVSSQADSRTILDMGGAEKLLGRGDMLFYPSGTSKPIRVQGCFVSEAEIEKIVEYIKEQYKESPPEYDTNIMEEINADKTQEASDEYDELLPEAIQIVVEAGQASISMLQRRLRIGYARAARMIDEMEVRGIVSGFEGSKPRKVLITKDEFEQKYMEDIKQ